MPKPPLIAARTPRADAAPASEAEAWLAVLWARLIEVGWVGPDDDFFALGGSPLLAIRVAAEAEAHFGQSLPNGVVHAAPTVRRLARLVGRPPGRRWVWPNPWAHWGSNDWGGATGRAALVPHAPLARRRPGAAGGAAGVGPPLFCIPGSDGRAFTFEHLARRLGPARNVWAFEYRGTDGLARPRRTVAALADDFLATLRRTYRAPAAVARLGSAERPYRLLGFSMGGLVAFEAARRLRAAGATVAFVGLIDTAAPAHMLVPIEAQSVAQRAELHRSNLARYGGSRGPVRYFAEHAVYALGRRARRGWWAAARVADAAARSAGRAVPPGHRHPALRRLHAAAGRAYQPLPCAGRVTLFRAADNPVSGDSRDLGWSDFAAELEVRDVPGPHELVRRRHAADLAAAISAALGN